MYRQPCGREPDGLDLRDPRDVTRVRRPLARRPGAVHERASLLVAPRLVVATARPITKGRHETGAAGKPGHSARSDRAVRVRAAFRPGGAATTFTGSIAPIATFPMTPIVRMKATSDLHPPARFRANRWNTMRQATAVTFYSPTVTRRIRDRRLRDRRKWPEIYARPCRSLRTVRAAPQPHMPCTPPPGGVDAEQR